MMLCGAQHGAESVVLALVLVIACSGSGDHPEDTPAPPSAAASTGTDGSSGRYVTMEVTDGGTISGTVRFVGNVPPAKTVTIDEDRAVCGESREIQTVHVGAGKGLSDVVISLVDVKRGVALKRPASSPALDQRGCRFLPHVLLAPVGTPVNILNDDPLTHNVHTAAFDNRPVNRAQPKELHKIEVKFRAAEKVKVKCDIHGWMNAWIVVMEHPYYAVSDESGTFAIENVPAGTYQLEVWHETLGTNTRAVTVKPGETTNLSIDLGQS
ncbi:MAG: carboxypeptidase regulatory-like domain-containing protein [Gemmatimonadales bacterium]